MNNLITIGQAVKEHFQSQLDEAIFKLKAATDAGLDKDVETWSRIVEKYQEILGLKK